jgi:hypothetical protein
VAASSLWTTRIAIAALVVALACSKAAAEQWALLVAAPACADESWPTLRFAEQDISRLTELLARCGYSQKRIVRLSPKASRRASELSPTRANLLATLRQIAERTAENDTLLIVLSGHGGERRTSEENANFEPCFFPADGSPRDPATVLPLSEIVSTVEANAAAAEIVLFVDACRTRPKNAPAKESASQHARPPARWSILWSCSAGQSAYEDPRVQHGVFAHYLIEALRGSADDSDDGRITFPELAEFVGKRTETHVRDRLGKQQTPQIIAGSPSAPPVEIVTLPSARE